LDINQIPKGDNSNYEIDKSNVSLNEIIDEKLELHSVKVSRTKIPKNSMSPSGRARSRSNDQSSHNIRSALDYSTLDFLKNLSGKKNKDFNSINNNSTNNNISKDLDKENVNG